MLRDYRPIRWKWSPGEGGRPGARMDVDPETGTAHTATALSIADDGRAVVTLSEAGFGVPRRLEARVRRLRDGAEIERAAVPVEIGAVRGDAVYGHAAEPFPRVLLYRMRR